MTEVEFEEEDALLAQAPRREIMPGLGKILMKTGFIKTPKQANAAMALIAIISFALTIFVIFNYIV